MSTRIVDHMALNQLSILSESWQVVVRPKSPQKGIKHQGYVPGVIMVKRIYPLLLDSDTFQPAAVSSAKSKEFFEFCFVPLIPMSTKHVWLCSICRWEVPIQQGSVISPALLTL